MRTFQSLSEVMGHFLVEGDLFTDCGQARFCSFVDWVSHTGACGDPGHIACSWAVFDRVPPRPEAPRCHLRTVTGSAAPGSKPVWAGVESRLCRRMCDDAASKEKAWLQ